MAGLNLSHIKKIARQDMLIISTYGTPLLRLLSRQRYSDATRLNNTIDYALSTGVLGINAKKK